MKSQNILKLCGEWDTKLKDKIITILKTIVIIFVAMIFFYGLVYFIDDLFNGMLADWFTNQFTYSYYNSQSSTYYQTFNWHALKSYVITLGAVVIILWALSLILAVKQNEKRTIRKTTAKTGKLIKDFLTHNELHADIFPDEYTDIAIQMSELKNKIINNEQALKDESARKNDLIAYLAHDLKTPLTSIIGYLSLLDEAPEIPTEQRARYVHISLAKALRLESLINEFFDITRYNLHEIVLEKETFDLSYMLVQMADEFYPLLKEHGNSISVNAEESIQIYADPVKLARVFNNILKNAIAYSYPDSDILISANLFDNTVTIVFSNHGKTIPKQKLEIIFEKFFRMDESRATNTGGAGLGLAIAKEIVTLHGGTITANSEDELTTFTVSLPLHT